MLTRQRRRRHPRRPPRERHARRRRRARTRSTTRPPRAASPSTSPSLAAQNTGGAGTDTVLTAENVLGSSFGDVLAGHRRRQHASTAAAGPTRPTTRPRPRRRVDLSLAGAQDTGTAGTDTLVAMESVTGGSGRDSARRRPEREHPLRRRGQRHARRERRRRRPRRRRRLRHGRLLRTPARRHGQPDGRHGRAPGDTDLLTTVENATGSPARTLHRATARSTPSTVGAGNDRLRGLAGADSLIGGAGVDTVGLLHLLPDRTRRVGVVVNLAAGEAVGDGADSLALIENVKGSSFDDRLFGNALANTLQGGDGNDYRLRRPRPGPPRREATASTRSRPATAPATRSSATPAATARGSTAAATAFAASRLSCPRRLSREHPAEERQRARLVEELVEVAALGRLDAGRAAVRAGAAGEQVLGVGRPSPRARRSRGGRCPTPPGWPS